MNPEAGWRSQRPFSFGVDLSKEGDYFVEQRRGVDYYYLFVHGPSERSTNDLGRCWYLVGLLLRSCLFLKIIDRVLCAK